VNQQQEKRDCLNEKERRKEQKTKKAVFSSFRIKRKEKKEK